MEMGIANDMLITERDILNEYAAQVINNFSQYLDQANINISDETNTLVKLYKEMVVLKNTLYSAQYDDYRNIIEASGKFKLIDSYLKQL